MEGGIISKKKKKENRRADAYLDKRINAGCFNLNDISPFLCCK